jgi:hypothetical protein
MNEPLQNKNADDHSARVLRYLLSENADHGNTREGTLTADEVCAIQSALRLLSPNGSSEDSATEDFYVCCPMWLNPDAIKHMLAQGLKGEVEAVLRLAEQGIPEHVIDSILSGEYEIRGAYIITTG